MPVEYPRPFPAVLASKRVAKVAPFSMAQPRRGTPYVEPTGTDTPTIFEVEWLLQEHEAPILRDWVYIDLAGGTLQFEMPLRTEDGLRLVTGNFMPDGLLDRQREGTLWRYRATIVSRDGLGVPYPTFVDAGVGRATAAGLTAAITLTTPATPAPVASFHALRSSGTAAYQKSMGWTVNTFPEFPLNTIPQAWAAQHQFRLTAGAGAPQTFESAAIAPFAPFSGVYTDATNGVQITVTAANGAIVDVPLGETDGGGRYSVAWSLNGTSSAMPNNGTRFAALQTNGQTITFDFSQPVASFGLYLIDYLDFGGTGTLRIFSGATELFSETLDTGVALLDRDGIVGFVGYCANTTTGPFNRVTLTFTATASDFTGFDNLFVGTLAQRATLPVSTGQTVQFTDTSTNSPTSWLWNFGDSTTSTAQNPTKTYTAPGTYTVTLTATNASGSGALTKTGYIVVT